MPSNYVHPRGLTLTRTPDATPRDCVGGRGREPSYHSYGNLAKQFLNVFVIVDLRRTGDTDLKAIADDAAMLALAQPKSPGSCQALPSITDLFAACPGRSVSAGLTLADTAYLHARFTRPITRISGPTIGLAWPTWSTPWGRCSPTPRWAPGQLRRSPSPRPPPTDPLAQAASFVQSYAAATAKRAIARWTHPICVRVVGLADNQAAAVEARVEDVAKRVGVRIQPASAPT